jgi:hypothetical protein
MWPLVTDMTQDDPSKRPTMDEVVARFDEIVRGLSTWKLRSRVVGVRDLAIASFFRDFSHWGRRLKYIVQRVPPIPTPAPTAVPEPAPNGMDRFPLHTLILTSNPPVTE